MRCRKSAYFLRKKEGRQAEIMENIISLRNIVVEFDGEKILKNIDLDIRDKEFVTLLGPSGCGKTTTLRIIGGFLTPTSGDVMLDGKRINDLPPHKRDVNTVFQKYALFPHLNVYENIAFGLRIKKVSEKEIVRRVGEMLELVNLTGFEKRSIQRLSGGQQEALEDIVQMTAYFCRRNVKGKDDGMIEGKANMQFVGSLNRVIARYGDLSPLFEALAVTMDYDTYWKELMKNPRIKNPKLVFQTDIEKALLMPAAVLGEFRARRGQDPLGAPVRDKEVDWLKAFEEV